MWPFKNKIHLSKNHPTCKSVLCIPGKWGSDLDVLKSIVEATKGEYIAAGGVMMNAKKSCYFTIEICLRDDRMKDSFAVAGKGTGVTNSFLNEIGEHKLVVYIYADSGNLTAAENIAFAGEALLKAGGIGIKVETAGKAFEKEKWLQLTERFEESNLYQMFVIDSLYLEDQSIFSCGMHNLGLKDSIISGIPVQDAINLIGVFGYYQIIDKPIIQPHETFTPYPGEPTYLITEELNPPYNDKELFSNPFGMWRLTKIE